MAEYGSGGISMSLNHQARECHSSEEDHNQDHQSHHHSPRNSRALVLAPCSGGVGSNTGATKSIYRNRDGNCDDDGDMRMIQMLTSPQSDDSTQLLSRKPRGRPPGSKNKPKPPIIITREVSRDDSKAMHPIILEISAGSDIIETVSQFSVKRHVCLSILSGSGSVANVILRHSSSTHHNATVSVPGCFEILSFSGSFIYPPASTKPSSSPPFSISLAGGQGQVIGGIIAGPLIAASSVFLMAASFANPAFFRLPSSQNNEDHDHQDEEEINVKPKIDPNTGAVLSGNGGDETIYSGSTSHHLPSMSQLLNSQIPSDVLPPWAPPSSRPY